MKILLTGATGYIARRLLPLLIHNGHQVVCCVRDRRRFCKDGCTDPQVTVIEVDFLNQDTLGRIPNDIEGAYYLLHSMAATSGDFEQLEVQAAQNFNAAMQNTSVKHVVYLSGIVNERELSKHLASRKKVEDILSGGSYNLTTLRAGIIIGSGSASFEIIRDLVEKLPFMLAPKWLLTRSQPIAIGDVIKCLVGTLMNEKTFNRDFDIGGADILTYKEMLLQFARIRKLKRWIITIPVMTPRLSSYWLFMVTSVSYNLAVNLVNSMKVEVVCRDNELMEMLGIKPCSFSDSVEAAFQTIKQNVMLSSWSDSFVSGRLNFNLSKYIEVPEYGCYKEKRQRQVAYPEAVLEKLWAIGGDKGWYYANWLWTIRGLIDKMLGGVGRRSGKSAHGTLTPGDSVDFWRVLYADPDEKRLLLFAEMKLPGEAWLEFRMVDDIFLQEATFRPTGIFGRIYWFALIPVHYIVFKGMFRKLIQAKPSRPGKK